MRGLLEAAPAPMLCLGPRLHALAGPRAAPLDGAHRRRAPGPATLQESHDLSLVSQSSEASTR
jgi:hypothetical protein